ncbi:hypothetical protein HPB49_014141 [Dermacentor silvarum]|uniref:Uncharacterized protein n=1 Tax=Dermacentor silvarum TaxID=543639 RepID=A0ACB8DDU7_DERSI|nr:hypothetical protein HPB49_014141 [Dermacentor silvarum]
MADGERSGPSFPKRLKGKIPGEKSPEKVRGSPKGTGSPKSARGGGSDSPSSQHYPTTSVISPPEQDGELRKVGEQSSQKGTDSPKRVVPPANLQEKLPAKPITNDFPASSRANTSGRASPRKGDTPIRKSSPMRGDTSTKPAASLPKQSEAGVSKPGNASPRRLGPSIKLNKAMTPLKADESPLRGPAKRRKSGSTSPKGQSSPKRGPLPVRAGALSTSPGGAVAEPEGQSANIADSPPTVTSTPSGGSTPIRRASLDDAGVPAALEPRSAKNEVAATPTAKVPSTTRAAAARRRPTISLKDPRFRYFARALMAHRGRRAAEGHSGTSSPNGRVSPSAAPSNAAEDDNTILELGTSQVNRSTGGFGRRRSGAASPGYSRSWPGSGTKYDGEKRSRPSFVVLTGACFLALLVSAIMLVIVLQLISLFRAPSHQKHTGQRDASTSTKNPRSGTGVASIGDAYTVLLREAIDSDAKPCDNFYRFACGSWYRNHPHISSRAESFRYFIATAVTRMRNAKAEKAGEKPIDKAVRFLNACLATAEDTAANELKAVLAEAGLTWPDRSDGANFISALFFMARRLALPVFFGVDLLDGGASGRRTLTFPLDFVFQSILRRLKEHVISLQVVSYLRLAYDSLAVNGFDDARFSEILVGLVNMTDVFEVYLNSTDKEETLGGSTSLLRIAPLVPEEKWNALLKKYFEALISEVDNVVVFDSRSFAAILNLLKTRGEDRAKDILGCLCVHAALFYTKAEVRESFFGSPEEAMAQQERHCFRDVYGLFRPAVVRFLLKGAEEALADVSQLALRVGDEFRKSLRSGVPLQDQPYPYSEVTSFGKVFALLETSKPGSFLDLHEAYPNVTSRPLQNRVNFAERLARRSDFGIDESVDVARRPAKVAADHLREWEGDVGISYLGFRLAPYHLFFPWFSASAHHRAALYAGIGARLAAALYFNYAERRPFGRNVLLDGHRCLASNQEGLDAPLALELQAGVAGVGVAWRAYENMRRNITTEPETPSTEEGFGAIAGPRAFFAFGCHLFCGEEDGEKMCNVPLRHNADFARVFECKNVSLMNPEKKCDMFG